MKATRQQLVQEVAQLSKENHLWRIALREALEVGGLQSSLQADVTTFVDAKESYQFFFLELDRPHGGVILLRHSVQQSDGSFLVTPAVYYLDDLDAELRHAHQPGQTFWNLFSGPLHKAKLRREEACHACAS